MELVFHFSSIPLLKVKEWIEILSLLRNQSVVVVDQSSPCQAYTLMYPQGSSQKKKEGGGGGGLEKFFMSLYPLRMDVTLLSL